MHQSVSRVVGGACAQRHSGAGGSAEGRNGYTIQQHAERDRAGVRPVVGRGVRSRNKGRRYGHGCQIADRHAAPRRDCHTHAEVRPRRYVRRVPKRVAQQYEKGACDAHCAVHGMSPSEYTCTGQRWGRADPHHTAAAATPRSDKVVRGSCGKRRRRWRRWHRDAVNGDVQQVHPRCSYRGRRQYDCDCAVCNLRVR